MFAVLAGGQLFGFLGMLLALPVAAVANVLLRYAHARYTQSRLYAGQSPAPGVTAERVSDGGLIVPPASDDEGEGKAYAAPAPRRPRSCPLRTPFPPPTPRPAACPPPRGR